MPQRQGFAKDKRGTQELQRRVYVLQDTDGGQVHTPGSCAEQDQRQGGDRARKQKQRIVPQGRAKSALPCAVLIADHQQRDRDQHEHLAGHRQDRPKRQLFLDHAIDAKC